MPDRRVQERRATSPAPMQVRQRRACRLAFTLQAAALTVVGLLWWGEGLPSELGLLLVLLGAAALCVHHQMLFAAELSITAETAVFVCAVVTFRNDAPLLAPALLGLAAGWLDSYHWSTRAWAPMAYNSGSRALEALIAAVAFQGVADALGGSTGALVLAACVAAVVLPTVTILSYALLVVVRDGSELRAAVASIF